MTMCVVSVHSVVCDAVRPCAGPGHFSHSPISVHFSSLLAATGAGSVSPLSPPRRSVNVLGVSTSPIYGLSDSLMYPPCSRVVIPTRRSFALLPCVVGLNGVWEKRDGVPGSRQATESVDVERITHKRSRAGLLALGSCLCALRRWIGF